MKKLVLLAVLFWVPLVSGHVLNNTLLINDGLNLTINVTHPWNFTELIGIDNSLIYISNLTSSHPSSASGEGVTFNISEENRTYTGLNAPYFSSSNAEIKKITSAFTSDLTEVAAYLDVTDCNVDKVYYSSGDSTYNGELSSANFGCLNTHLKVNLSGIETGVNTLTLGYNVSLSNCSTGNVTLEFSIYDEDVVTTYLNATARVYINYWNTSALDYNFTHTFSGNSTYRICLEPSGHSLRADAFIQYNVSGGYSHRYYLLNASLSNETTTLSLYNYNTTSTTETFKLTAVDESYNMLPNTYIKMLRYYPGENAWRIVQMDKADDFARGYFHVREQDTDYKFTFQDYTSLLETSNPLHFWCPSTDECKLTFVVNTITTANRDFSEYTYDYSETSEIFNMSWEDTTGATDSITLQAWSDTTTGRVLWCNTTVASASGTINCNLTAASGQVYVTAFRTASPTYSLYTYIVRKLSTDLYTIMNTNGLGREGIFFGFLITTTIILIGAFSPVTLAVSIPLSLAVSYIMGWFNFMTLTFVIVAVVGGILVFLLVGRRGDG